MADDKKDSKKKADTKKEELETKAHKDPDIAAHVDKLHPISSNLGSVSVNSEESITLVQSMLRVEIILTVILVGLVGVLLFVTIRNPGSVQTVEVPAPTTTPEDNTDVSVTPTLRDNRDTTTSSGGSGEADKPDKLYLNEDLGFTIKYFKSWKLTEQKVVGVTTTRITDTNAKFDTYISFQTKEPDCEKISSEGTFNVRDVNTFDAIFRAEGYIAFGNALCASFPVIPGEFYVQFAGNYEDSILPVMSTFTY